MRKRNVVCTEAETRCGQVPVPGENMAIQKAANCAWS